MVYREDQCVGCPPELGCLGDGCPNRNVPVFECDDCREEVTELYIGEDGGEYCQSCICNHLEKVSERL